MIRKELSFLSDQTLLSMLSSNSKNLGKIQPELDEQAFGFFVQSHKKSEAIGRRIRLFVFLFLYVSLTTGLFLFFKEKISSEVFCVLIVVSSISFLFIREKFSPKNRKQKTYADYQEAFLSFLAKEKVIKHSQHEDIFNVLIVRMSMILGLNLDLETKKSRLKLIVSEINKTEDNFNKVFTIPVKLKNVLGSLDLFFKGQKDEDLKTFFQKHSLSLTQKKKLVKSLPIDSFVEEEVTN